LCKRYLFTITEIIEYVCTKDDNLATLNVTVIS